MTTDEYNLVRIKSGWSDRILKDIDSVEEAQIYIRAGLKEAVVGGRPALIRLHRMGEYSVIDRGQFDDEKSRYWQDRYNMFTDRDLRNIYR